MTEIKIAHLHKALREFIGSNFVEKERFKDPNVFYDPGKFFELSTVSNFDKPGSGVTNQDKIYSVSEL